MCNECPEPYKDQALPMHILNGLCTPYCDLSSLHKETQSLMRDFPALNYSKRSLLIRLSTVRYRGANPFLFCSYLNEDGTEDLENLGEIDEFVYSEQSMFRGFAAYDHFNHLTFADLGIVDDQDTIPYQRIQEWHRNVCKAIYRVVRDDRKAIVVPAIHGLWLVDFYSHLKEMGRQHDAYHLSRSLSVGAFSDPDLPLPVLLKMLSTPNEHILFSFPHINRVPDEAKVEIALRKLESLKPRFCYDSKK